MSEAIVDETSVRSFVRFTDILDDEDCVRMRLSIGCDLNAQFPQLLDIQPSVTWNQFKSFAAIGEPRDPIYSDNGHSRFRCSNHSPTIHLICPNGYPVYWHSNRDFCPTTAGLNSGNGFTRIGATKLGWYDGTTTATKWIRTPELDDLSELRASSHWKWVHLAEVIAGVHSTGRVLDHQHWPDCWPAAVVLNLVSVSEPIVTIEWLDNKIVKVPEYLGFIRLGADIAVKDNCGKLFSNLIVDDFVVNRRLGSDGLGCDYIDSMICTTETIAPVKAWVEGRGIGHNEGLYSSAFDAHIVLITDSLGVIDWHIV